MANQRKVTGAQIRAARAMLNFSANDLADMTALSRGTIQRAELGGTTITASNLARIAEMLEASGVIFLPDNGDGPGVRLKKPEAASEPEAKPHRMAGRRKRRRPKNKRK